MTDGIIKEIFRPYIYRHRRYNNDPYYGELSENTAKEFEHLQQELVEKIKQEYNNPDKLYYLTTFQFCRKLIGDNQE